MKENSIARADFKIAERVEKELKKNRNRGVEIRVDAVRTPRSIRVQVMKGG